MVQLPATPLVSWAQHSLQMSSPVMAEIAALTLPLALPKGFADLRRQISIDDGLITLISRNACFPFAGPGVGFRIQALLAETILSRPQNGAGGIVEWAGHPIESYLRVACVCLTIFQGQRAGGQELAQDPRYNVGLDACWTETMGLDPSPLRDPNAAEAAIWVMFIISVTCAPQANGFRELLRYLLDQHQIRYWENVRHLLSNFIYPASFLDVPCKQFYDSLYQS